MEAKAYVKGVRISPRKVRLVLDNIRGKDVKEAAAILKFSRVRAGEIFGKALKSAVSNAVNNHDAEEDNLYVKECYADEGPTLKRWMPRAKGSASQILKRSSHITIVVSDTKEEVVSKKAKKTAKKEVEEEVTEIVAEEVEEPKKATKKASPKKATAKKDEAKEEKKTTKKTTAKKATKAKEKE